MSDPQPSAAKATSGLATLGLLALSLLVSLVLAEAALRLFDYRYTPMSIQRPGALDRRNYHLFEDLSFTYDPELIWAPKKSHDIFNAQGYRGEALPPGKKPGELRILAVGDSNTLGWPGTDGANWPADLESLARGRGFPAHVANAGVWGYSSFQGVARLKRYLDLKPDIVLISFGSNDAHPVAVSDREYLARHAGQSSLFQRLGGLRLGELVAAVRDRLASPAQDAELGRRVTLDDYRENLAGMIRLAREAGAAVVLLTRPYVGESNHPLWWKNVGADYNAATVEVAAAQDAPVIDIYTAFRDRRGFFTDESHFTKEGHRLAAELVFSQLAPLLY
jgi:lysophospholipase L1-like esterase